MFGEVIETIQLTPSLRRIVLSGGDLDEFVGTEFTDQYVNAFFFPPGVTPDVPFDHDALDERPADQRPRGRRYTIRSWDPATRRVAIDFVVHGDVGLAGRWAATAQVGDRLQFAGPGGAYAPSATADWHLMVGDESALPAIAASLERLRPGVPALVVLIVDDADDELALFSPATLDLRWVHRRSDPGNPELLLAAVAAAEFPTGTPDVFIHGEAAEVRAVRKHLIAERGIARDGTSISPYWRRTLDDEAWRQIKRQWLAEVATDA